MKLCIFYVKKDGSICQTANMQEALENAVSDFYFVGEGRTPWGPPPYLGCYTTIQEIAAFLEDCVGIQLELCVYPATPELWNALQSIESDYIPYKLLPDGRADLDMAAINAKKSRLEKWRVDNLASDSFYADVEQKEYEFEKRDNGTAQMFQSFEPEFAAFQWCRGTNDIDNALKHATSLAALLKLFYRSEFLAYCARHGLEPDYNFSSCTYLMPVADIDRVYQWALTRRNGENLYAEGICATLEWLASGDSDELYRCKTAKSGSLLQE